MPWDCWGDEWEEPLKPTWWEPVPGNRVRIIEGARALIGVKATVVRRKKHRVTIIPDFWCRPTIVDSCSIIKLCEPDRAVTTLPPPIKSGCPGSGATPNFTRPSTFGYYSVDGLCPVCSLWISLSTARSIAHHGSRVGSRFIFDNDERRKVLAAYVKKFIRKYKIYPPFYVSLGGMLPLWSHYKWAGFKDWNEVISAATKSESE